MKNHKLQILTLLGATLLSASVAMAGESKVNCDQIRHALQSGKSQEQVAEELKVSTSSIKQCMADKHTNQKHTSPKHMK